MNRKMGMKMNVCITIFHLIPAHCVSVTQTVDCSGDLLSCFVSFFTQTFSIASGPAWSEKSQGSERHAHTKGIWEEGKEGARYGIMTLFVGFTTVAVSRLNESISYCKRQFFFWYVRWLVFLLGYSPS